MDIVNMIAARMASWSVSILALAAIVLILWSPSAGAACSCLCVDGQSMTVCDEPGEATRDECMPQWEPTAQGYAPEIVGARPACPTPEGVDDPQSYAPPVEGATGCRDREVTDFAGNVRYVRRVCDI